MMPTTTTTTTTTMKTAGIAVGHRFNQVVSLVVEATNSSLQFAIKPASLQRTNASKLGVEEAAGNGGNSFGSALGCDQSHGSEEPLHVQMSTFWYCFLAFVTSIGLLVSLVSNMILIYLFFGTPSFRRIPSNIIAVNLSLSDLLYCIQWPSVIYCSLSQSTWMLEIDFVCKTFGFITVTTASASVLTVLAMSVERAIVIKYSIQAKSRYTIRSAWLIVVLIWFISITSSLPPLFDKFNRFTLDPSKTSCTLDYLSGKTNFKLYMLLIYIIYWILPATIITICYLFIMITFKRSSRRLVAVGAKPLTPSWSSETAAGVAGAGPETDEAGSGLRARAGGGARLEAACRRSVRWPSTTSVSMSQLRRSSTTKSATSRSQRPPPPPPSPKHALEASHSNWRPSDCLNESVNDKSGANMMQADEPPDDGRSDLTPVCFMSAPFGREQIGPTGGTELVVAYRRNEWPPSCGSIRLPSRSKVAELLTTTPRHSQLEATGASSTAPLAATLSVPSGPEAGNDPKINSIHESNEHRCRLLQWKDSSELPENMRGPFGVAVSRGRNPFLALVASQDLNPNAARQATTSRTRSPRSSRGHQLGLDELAIARLHARKLDNSNGNRNNDDRNNDNAANPEASTRSELLSPATTTTSGRYSGCAHSVRLAIISRVMAQLNRYNSTGTGAKPKSTTKPTSTTTTTATATTTTATCHFGNPSSHSTARASMQIRLAKMSFYLILLWLVSWTPIASLTLINLVVKCHLQANALMLFLANTMTKLGPTFDVFIYGISHPKIKKRFIQIIGQLLMLPGRRGRRPKFNGGARLELAALTPAARARQPIRKSLTMNEDKMLARARRLRGQPSGRTRIYSIPHNYNDPGGHSES